MSICTLFSHILTRFPTPNKAVIINIVNTLGITLMASSRKELLCQSFRLPCGVLLKNRIIKSAMSDSLGDGRGDPTEAQVRLYERWAEGGVAAMIIGEVQFSSDFAEKPGNLILAKGSDGGKFKELAQRGSSNGAQLWLQLGHAGAMAYPPTSTPRGPSAINIPGLNCDALSLKEIKDLPMQFAESARLAQSLGFTGVQIHAAHGFLLSQFLSPLFNQRVDGYGGSIESRMRLLMEVIDAVRAAVSAQFVVAVKLNSTDQLEGGLEEADALKVVSALDKKDIDLIDISGGTYFPGAKSASDSSGDGPYFLNFAKRARELTTKPIMTTGGFKTFAQTQSALAEDNTDFIGLARTLALDPNLPNRWLEDQTGDPEFPCFESPPEGGVTAWYSMRLTHLGQDCEKDEVPDLRLAIETYNTRDENRIELWNARRKHQGRVR
jgi:2,4-dienoyl-CoA reductase-like NADH-dependent reductase (Old Yellow Enzyme family)